MKRPRTEESERAKVVEAIFGVAFFAGEFVGRAVGAGDLFAEGELVHGVLDGISRRSSGHKTGDETSRTEVVGMNELGTRSAKRVLRDEFSAKANVSIQPAT